MIQITTTVYKQLMAVRETGLVNMADREGVWNVAAQVGFFELTQWLEDAKPGDLGLLVLGKFEVIGKHRETEEEE